MFQHEIQIRVRYGETDQMGFVYYGVYAQYFEVARVEALRSLGHNYKRLEENGVILPVLEYRIKYIKPAFYDDLLNVKTTIKKLPGARIHFDYQTFNAENTLLNVAETTLVFLDRQTKRPRNAPDDFLQSLSSYF